MIRLFQWLIFGCAHKWVDTGGHIRIERGEGREELKQAMKCQHCGERKTVKIAP